MWTYDGFLDKATTYLQRATRCDRDSDEFALWLILRLEFLLRAPLAKKSPLLLAESDDASMLAAAGHPLPDREPKSVTTATVLKRLKLLSIAFNQDRVDDASYLVNLRNKELHTGARALQEAPTDNWLPKFTRVVNVLAALLDVAADDLLDKTIIQQGQALVDAEDKRLEYEITARIKTHQEKFEALTDDKRQARLHLGPIFMLLRVATYGHRQECPACKSPATLFGHTVYQSPEKPDNDKPSYEYIVVADRFECSECGLVLTSTAEIKAARMPQQFTHMADQPLSDEYEYEPAEPDYRPYKPILFK